MPRGPVKVPVCLRTIAGKPLALLPAAPWGLDTMSAYSVAKGWHEADESLTSKGRPCSKEEAGLLLASLTTELATANGIPAPQSRVGQATHEARKALARKLDEEYGQ